MGRVRIVDTAADAEGIYQKFQAKPHHRHVPMPFGWHAEVQEIGEGCAQMYHSNKWKNDPREYEDYKHIAEGPQIVYATPGFLREWKNPRRHVPVYGPVVPIEGEMPEHFAVLAPLLGVQIRLFDENGEATDEGLYEVTVKHGMVGATHHPATGETLIFVYTKSGGIHMIFTGKKLDVEKDGIVG